MDLIKIGAYIAAKRKALGMTQVELARNLGMSDKSVSKWERGICLPDVSVYVQLCGILGITVNEFIAGEDLNAENLVQQSEVNIIAVTEEENQKRKRMKQIFLGVTAIYFVVICMMGMLQGIRFRNYIEPIPDHSTEMMMAETIFEEDGAYIYSYDVDNVFNSLSVNLTIYKKGEVVKQQPVASIDLHEARSNGMVLLFPDYETSKLKVVVTAEDRKISGNVPILEDEKNKELMHRSNRALGRSIDVLKGDEVNLVCFIYSEGELISLPLEDLVEGDSGKENDYMYLFSAKFE